MGDRPQRRVPLEQLAQSIGLDRVVAVELLDAQHPIESPPEPERSRISLGEVVADQHPALAQAHGGQLEPGLGQPLGLAHDALAIDEDVVGRVVAAERVVGVGDHDLNVERVELAPQQPSDAPGPEASIRHLGPGGSHSSGSGAGPRSRQSAASRWRPRMPTRSSRPRGCQRMVTGGSRSSTPAQPAWYWIVMLSHAPIRAQESSRSQLEVAASTPARASGSATTAEVLTQRSASLGHRFTASTGAPVQRMGGGRKPDDRNFWQRHAPYLLGGLSHPDLDDRRSWWQRSAPTVLGGQPTPQAPHASDAAPVPVATPPRRVASPPSVSVPAPVPTSAPVRSPITSSSSEDEKEEKIAEPPARPIHRPRTVEEIFAENNRQRNENYLGLLSDSRQSRASSSTTATPAATPIDGGPPRRLSNVTNLASIPSNLHAHLQSRIDAFNAGRHRAHGYHSTGVGGVPTMDVAAVTGGGGGSRGDGRLQFHSDGSMTVVDHKGKAL